MQRDRATLHVSRKSCYLDIWPFITTICGIIIPSAAVAATDAQAYKKLHCNRSLSCSSLQTMSLSSIVSEIACYHLAYVIACNLAQSFSLVATKVRPYVRYVRHFAVRWPHFTGVAGISRRGCDPIFPLSASLPTLPPFSLPPIPYPCWLSDGCYQKILLRLQLHFYVYAYRRRTLFFSITYVQYAYFIPEGDVRSLLGCDSYYCNPPMTSCSFINTH